MFCSSREKIRWKPSVHSPKSKSASHPVLQFTRAFRRWSRRFSNASARTACISARERRRTARISQNFSNETRPSDVIGKGNIYAYKQTVGGFSADQLRARNGDDPSTQSS